MRRCAISVQGLLLAGWSVFTVDRCLTEVILKSGRASNSRLTIDSFHEMEEDFGLNEGLLSF